MADSPFPSLPFDVWTPSRVTMHLRLQVIGKIRKALMPPRNHWWHVALYLSPNGFTTRPMPTGDGRLVEIEIDVREDAVRVRPSDAAPVSLAVTDGQSIATFYAKLMEALADVGVAVEIQPTPFDMPSTIPFAEDETHDAYDADAVRRFWRVLTQIQPIFQRFQGRFLGKDTPVHLFWHSLDLAYTRFSGRPGPPLPDADPVTQEAYSHEVISFGFWAGDDSYPQPAFYSYTYPEPENLTDEPLSPEGAVWRTQESGSSAIFPYEEMRSADSPAAALDAFLENAYAVGAKLAGWDRERLDRTEAEGAGTADP